MAVIKRTVVIERPVTQVFAFAADPANDAQWQAGLVRHEGLPEQQLAPGMRWVEVRRVPGRQVRVTVELTAYEPDWRVGFRALDGPVRPTGEMRFEQDSGGRTQMTYEADFRVVGFLRPLESLLARRNARDVAADLDALKRLLETAG
jgi:uncharacterized membrane protein